MKKVVKKKVIYINKTTNRLIKNKIYYAEETFFDYTMNYSQFYWIDGIGHILKTNFIDLKEFRKEKLKKLNESI